MSTAQSQGELWGGAARDWAFLFEPMSKPLWLAMLDAAEVQTGTRFVDLGCGGGGASILAAQRGAKVSGLDAAGALIAIARERLPEGDFLVGDLESIVYDDDSFEVAFASLSLMFAGDTRKALSEMSRITTRGGRITIGVWGAPNDCEYRHVLRAIANALPEPPGGKGPFALSERGVLEGMMEDTGLKLASSGDVDVPFFFEDAVMMLRMIGSAGPIQAAKRLVRERILEAAILAAAQPFQTSRGGYRFRNRLRYVTAIA